MRGCLSCSGNGVRQQQTYFGGGVVYQECNCRGGPPWSPVVQNRSVREKGGHGGPPAQCSTSTRTLCRAPPGWSGCTYSGREYRSCRRFCRSSSCPARHGRHLGKC